MGPVGIVLIVIGVLLIGGIVSMLAVTLPISKKVYEGVLVRKDKDCWGRVCSAPDNEEQIAMWNIGVKWAEEQKEHMEEVQIENDGLRLFGEFYNYGGDKCVIILPGRCESLMYSYFFAAPYPKAGFNVLVIDNRAHGKSDGKYTTIGHKESGDILKWISFIENKYGIKEIYLHGICIGSAGAMLAMNNKDCPDSVKGLIAEGSFYTFRETFKTHMIRDKRPLFPVLDLVMLRLMKTTGMRVYRDSPARNVKFLRQPVLFIYSEKDVFSLPKMSEKLFKRCGSKDKHIAWFTDGNHSHIRLAHPVEYDNAVTAFITGTLPDKQIISALEEFRA